MTPGLRTILVVAALGVVAPALYAVDTWVEIKAPTVTVLANGSTGEARRLAWQFEQVRAAIVQILPWARVDLDRPFVAFAVNNE